MTPLTPRDGDNLGTMVCYHRRYTLGDERPETEAEDYLLKLARAAVSPNYPEALLARNREAILRANYVILPLYLYDHSGISMRAAPFSCGWDSGQVGFIFLSLGKARENWTKGKRNASWNTPVTYPGHSDTPATTKSLRERVIDCLTAEVSTYDQFLRGEVYGYEVKHEVTGKEESCWGFFQEKLPNAEGSYVLAQAREIAESLNSEHLEAEVKREAAAQVEEAEAQKWACADLITV